MAPRREETGDLLSIYAAIYYFVTVGNITVAIHCLLFWISSIEFSFLPIKIFLWFSCFYSFRSKVFVERFRQKVEFFNSHFFSTGELANCWYILLSGSVFIDGSMFLPRSRYVATKLHISVKYSYDLYYCNNFFFFCIIDDDRKGAIFT